MRLRFLGTRGEIEARTRRHQRHSSLLITRRRRKIVIDWGQDWAAARNLARFSPHAIVITHAHPDHAGGLKVAAGTACPVFATAQAWRDMRAYPIQERRTIRPRERLMIEGVAFEAFAVEHSIRRPAVCYRVWADGARFVYAPDVVSIHDRSQALRGIDLYIGDGATLIRPLVRRRGSRVFGHAAIRAQVEWCGQGVPRAIFTHCGSQIVKGDERRIGARIRRWGRSPRRPAATVEARIAYDGMELNLRRD